MIYHNRHLTVTESRRDGPVHVRQPQGLGGLRARRPEPGDIVVTGKNFGAGSSRQQAVDCFISLGVAAIVAESFGAIYKRNAINAGLPIVAADLLDPTSKMATRLRPTSRPGRLKSCARAYRREVQGAPFSGVQLSDLPAGRLADETSLK